VAATGDEQQDDLEQGFQIMRSFECGWFLRIHHYTSSTLPGRASICQV
jgi:hypothetical protein